MRTTTIKTYKILDGLYLQELARKLDTNGNIKIKYGLVFTNTIYEPKTISHWSNACNNENDRKHLAILMLKELYPGIDLYAGAMEYDIINNAKEIKEVWEDSRRWLYFDRCSADGSPDRVAFNVKGKSWTVL